MDKNVTEDILKRMQEDAKRCNARLRRITGNYSPAQNSEKAKLNAAKGGRTSRRYKARTTNAELKGEK